MHRVDAAPLLPLEYAEEPDVSEALDRELRELISGAFNQPHNLFFKQRRYAQEMPRHRYLLRSLDGRLVAHLAVHDKVVSVTGEAVAIGGIAEVCVHESARGRGHVRRLLERAHHGLVERGVDFAFLFGDSNIYGSSGYQPITALIRCFNPTSQAFEEAPIPSALVKPLGSRPWPAGPI